MEESDGSFAGLITYLESLPKGHAEKILEIKKENWIPSARERWDFYHSNMRRIFSIYKKMQEEERFSLINNYLMINDRTGRIIGYCDGTGFGDISSSTHTLEWELRDFATKTKQEDLPVSLVLRISGYREMNTEGNRVVN
jgi:hypothetical protein